MLKIELYPVMSGLMVRALACNHELDPNGERLAAAAVNRTIPAETIESLGLDQAVRDCLLDIISLYPGLLSEALR